MNGNITGENCLGCLACVNICPRHAISRDLNSVFVIPAIDETACVKCGLCLEVCPKEEGFKQSGATQQAYAVKHMDAAVLDNSTSGGAFSAIADYVLKENGVIYGCVLENGVVQHVRTDQDYTGMRGSKYVQSDLKKAHIDIAKDIASGKKVLFTGTPCQCASVKKFLLTKKMELDNLILVDFVCHGVTSPTLFREYISFYEKKVNKKICNHLFRSKINGWVNHTEMNVLSDGTKDYSSYESQLFKSIFYSHLGMNEGCFECKFASKNRASDITLADFWGIKKSHPDLFDPKGVSFVLVNSIKGQTVFDHCENIEKHKVSITDTEQPALYGPATKPPKYDCFWNDYKRKGFGYLVKKYYCGGTLRRMISKIYRKFLKR